VWSKRWNLAAAILGILTGILTVIAALASNPSVVATMALLAGITGILCGVAWAIAAALDLR
jgi:Na+(H+)/acetate symporter ActP